MMNPTDAEVFRQACHLASGDPIPYCVEQAYWDYKWAKDAIDASPLRLEEVGLVVSLSGFSKGKGRKPDQDVPIPDLIKSGAVADGDPIQVTWRFGHPTVGQYKGFVKVRGTVMVQLPDENDPREFDMARVVGLPAITV